MEEIQAIQPGKTVAKRWTVQVKLGEGGMGAVFKVRDKLKFKTYAAMKVEADLSDGGVLKLEATVLRSLEKMEAVPRLMDSGEMAKFGYIVMTMLGPDLMAHKRTGGVAKLCEQTTLRIGMATLYAIKQLHEAGWVHRDIKPGNMVTGISGNDRKNIYLIDYGMVRSFVARTDTGRIAIRKPRPGEQMFRGTPRYCSQNVHQLKEQGRVDDLWSWLYMLVELHQGLPWRRLTDEKQIADAKATTDAESLLKGCPKEFLEIHAYLEGLKFRDRPDYMGLWSTCMAGFKRVSGSFFNATEWEMVENMKRDEERKKKKEEEEKKKADEEARNVQKKPRPERETIFDGLALPEFTAVSITAGRKDNKKPKNMKTLAKKIWPFANGDNFKKKILNL